MNVLFMSLKSTSNDWRPKLASVSEGGALITLDPNKYGHHFPIQMKTKILMKSRFTLKLWNTTHSDMFYFPAGSSSFVYCAAHMTPKPSTIAVTSLSKMFSLKRERQPVPGD